MEGWSKPPKVEDTFDRQEYGERMDRRTALKWLRDLTIGVGVGTFLGKKIVDNRSDDVDSPPKPEENQKSAEPTKDGDKPIASGL